MTRKDYFDDPAAPAANSLVPAVSAVVTDDFGRLLLQRRRDNGRWALAGGAMELGESVSQAVMRETLEETGYLVAPSYVIGVYSDPRHVFAYDDGEVRQEFSICIAARVTGGELSVSNESTEVEWFDPEEIKGLDMHPQIRLRIRDYLKGAKAVIR